MRETRKRHTWCGIVISNRNGRVGEVGVWGRLPECAHLVYDAPQSPQVNSKAVPRRQLRRLIARRAEWIAQKLPGVLQNYRDAEINQFYSKRLTEGIE